MSSPVSAWEGCSRLSPYLAWGCISLREVYQRTKAVADALRAAKAGSKGGRGKGGRGGGSGKGSKSGQAAGAKKRQRRLGRQQLDEEGGESEGEEEAAGNPAAESGDKAAAAEGPAAEGAPLSSSSGPALGLKDLAAFTARLRWRSHFMQVCPGVGGSCWLLCIAGGVSHCELAVLVRHHQLHRPLPLALAPVQKLEDEPSLVCVNMCRAYDGARNEEAPHDPALFTAWCTVRPGHTSCIQCMAAEVALSALMPVWRVALQRLLLQGRTGFPLVDAVVRCLLKGGWINFRMRAMVFSFAHYHLWLHW